MRCTAPVPPPRQVLLPRNLDSNTPPGPGYYNKPDLPPKKEGVGDGGGVAFDTASAVTLVNVTFAWNVASSGNGGAVSLASNTTAEVTDASFRNNTAANGFGGAVYLIAKASLEISETLIVWNSASEGGGGLVGW